MAEILDADLRRRTWELLQPGEIELNGLVVTSDFDSSEETAMHQATVEIGDCIAEHAGLDPTETFVYSGTDNSEFASNQHQGLTLDDESFVWECQQLFRDGSFDIVFYFEATENTAELVEEVRAQGYESFGVSGDVDSPADAGINPA
jgi:phosphoglycolate phosphatase-like HAD superfamily hydrolase